MSMYVNDYSCKNDYIIKSFCHNKETGNIELFKNKKFLGLTLITWSKVKPAILFFFLCVKCRSTSFLSTYLHTFPFAFFLDISTVTPTPSPTTKKYIYPFNTLQDI